MESTTKPSCVESTTIEVSKALPDIFLLLLEKVGAKKVRIILTTIGFVNKPRDIRTKNQQQNNLSETRDIIATHLRSGNEVFEGDQV